MNKKNNDLGSTKRFGYEWKKYSEVLPEYEKQFLKWVYPLKKSDFKNKTILDAGCGVGRNSYWPLKYGAKHAIVFDFDRRTLKSAENNLKNYKNKIIKYESIFDINYKEQFDIVFSIGVIHHLDRPKKAVDNLIKSVKKGGKALIWVYGYEGNEWIVKYVNPVRKITSRLPLRIVDVLSTLLTIPLYAKVKIFKQLHPYLNQLSYFTFNHTKSIVFDQLIPKIANYWKEEEVRELFNSKLLKDVKVFRVNNNSWTIIGTKI